MKNPIILFVFLTMFFVSCKKEKSVEGGSGGTSNTGSLLTKQVIKTGNDSSSITLAYDNSKRLVSYKTADVFQGNYSESELKLIRNAQGIIQKLVIKSDDLIPILGVDSLFYALNYDASKSRYTSMVFIFSDATDVYKDSTAFTYNAAGKMIQQESFSDDGTTGGYSEYSKTEYTYDASGNVITAKTYDFDDVAGRYNLSYQQAFEYDSKTNPLSLGNEAFILGDAALSSTHNVTKRSFDDADPTGTDDVSTTTYVYNSGNKPVTASQTSQSSGGTTSQITYTYK